MSALFEIAGRRIGPGHPAYVIAELSANHNQSLTQALDLIGLARECGADAVKIQTYTPDTITMDSDSPMFRHGNDSLWEGKSLYQLYSEAYTPWEWHAELFAHAKQVGIPLFSSPFDETAVDLLEKLNAPAYKIASFELAHLPLIRRAAQTGKPLIISTGMGSLQEVVEAVETAREGGCSQLALLKCTSAYPAPLEEMNLRTIPDMAQRVGVPVGLSDHTLGITSAVTAVALGGCIIEKHFTLSRGAPGPDSAFSMEPHEFKAMVDAVRETEKLLGSVSYEVSEHEKASRVFRRSLFVVADMKAGELFTMQNVRSIRPGHGLLPKHLDSVLGKKAACDISRGTPLSWQVVQ